MFGVKLRKTLGSSTMPKIKHKIVQLERKLNCLKKHICDTCTFSERLTESLRDFHRKCLMQRPVNNETSDKPLSEAVYFAIKKRMSTSFNPIDAALVKDHLSIFTVKPLHLNISINQKN